MKRITLILFMLLLFSVLSCRPPGDRCWVNNYRYNQAKEIYEETQTLDMLERHLEAQDDWRQCEINEVIYRIKKEYHLEEPIK